MGIMREQVLTYEVCTLVGVDGGWHTFRAECYIHLRTPKPHRKKNCGAISCTDVHEMRKHSRIHLRIYMKDDDITIHNIILHYGLRLSSSSFLLCYFSPPLFHAGICFPSITAAPPSVACTSIAPIAQSCAPIPFPTPYTGACWR